MRVESVTCLPPIKARQPTLAVITAVALSCILCGTLFLTGVGGLGTLEGALFLSAGVLLTGIALTGLKKTSKKRTVPPLSLEKIHRARDPSIPLVERVQALLPKATPQSVIDQIIRGFDLRVAQRKKMVWCVELNEEPAQAQFLTVPTIPNTVPLAENTQLLFILDTHGSLLSEKYTLTNNLLSYLAQGYENGVLLSKICLKSETKGLFSCLLSKVYPPIEVTPSFLVQENKVIYSDGCEQTFENDKFASTMGTELILRGLERTEMLMSHEIEKFHLNKQATLSDHQFWYGHKENVCCIITKNRIIFYNQEPKERLKTLQLFGWTEAP